MSTDVTSPSAGTVSRHTAPQGRRSRIRTAVAVTAVAAFVGGFGATASAAPGGDSTNVSVTVDSVLDLTVTSPDFALDGPAGAIVDLADAVTYTVTTNNLAGYSVGVEAAADVLTGASALDGTDTIPVEAMTVEQAESIIVGPQVLKGPAGAPLELVTTAERSESVGDAYTNDYSITIPNVTADIYTVQLNYTVSANV